MSVKWVSRRLWGGGDQRQLDVVDGDLMMSLSSRKVSRNLQTAQKRCSAL